MSTAALAQLVVASAATEPDPAIIALEVFYIGLLLLAVLAIGFVTVVVLYGLTRGQR